MGAGKDHPAPQRSRKRLLALFVFVAALAIAFGPRLVSHSSLRDKVIETIVGDPNLRVSTSGATFGWFQPLQISDLSIQSLDGSVDLQIAQLRAEKSCLSLLHSIPEIGQIDVVQPEVHIVVRDDAPHSPDVNEPFPITSLPTFSVNLQNGSLKVQESGTSEPVLDAQNINIAVRTEQRTTGSVLIIDPITLAEHETLTPEVCRQGMQLVAPELADEIGMQGEFSIDLTKMELAVGTSNADSQTNSLLIEGVVTLHQVTAGLTNDVTRRIVLAAAELMDLGEVPDQIRLTENAELTFQMTDQRVSHEGMVYFVPHEIPGLSVRTRGSVGLDESLDLQVLLSVPQSMLGETELAERISEAPLEMRITGTIEDPRVGVPEEQPWTAHINQRLQSPDLSAIEKKLANRILESIDEVRNELSSR